VADGMGTSAGAWHGCHFSVKEREREREIKGIHTAPHQAHGRQL